MEEMGNGRAAKSVEVKCTFCHRTLRNGVQCSGCCAWYHFNCTESKLEDCVTDEWRCSRCEIQKSRRIMEEKAEDLERLRAELEKAKSKIFDLAAENVGLKAEIAEMKLQLDPRLEGDVHTDRGFGGRKSESRITREEIDCKDGDNSEPKGETRKSIFREEKTKCRGRGRMEWRSRRQVIEERPQVEDGGEGATLVKTVPPRVKIIGDSIIRFAGGFEAKGGVGVHCFPGIRTEQLDRKISDMTSNGEESVVLIHVGTNDLRSAKSDDHLIGFIWDLATSVKNKFKSAKIVISGILRRRDVYYKRIDRINESIEWVCLQKEITFVDPNCWIGDRHLGRDGVHLNRKGSQVIANLFKNIAQKLCDQGNL